MLRWGQSTVHRLGGGGSSSRFYTRSALLHRTQRSAQTKTKTQTKLTPACTSIPPAVIIPRTAGSTTPLPSRDTPAAHRSSEADAAQERSTPVRGAAKAPAREDTNLIPPGKLALYRLRHWISDPRHRVAYTPEQLYNLYKAVKHRGHLAHLSPSHFSLLAHVFGMQTDANTALTSTRRIPVLRGSQSKPPGVYWDVILEIVKDMEEQGKAFSTSDLHWAMLAYLSLITSSTIDHVRHDAFKTASAYYDRLRRATPDPKAHLPYLRAIATIQRPSSHRQLIGRVSFLLETFHTLDDALLDFIWPIVLSERTHSSASAQSCIMKALRTRFQKIRRLPSTDRPESRRSQSTNDLQPIRSAILQVLHITEPTPLPSEAVRWAHQVVSQLFDQDLATRWYMLCLLAYSVAFDAHCGSAPLPRYTGKEDTLVVSWRTICLLDILARQADIGFPADVDVARSLIASCWIAWEASTTYPKAGHELVVARAIVATFLRLAAWTKDAKLAARCVAFAKSRALFHLPHLASESARASVRGLVHAFLEARATASHAGGWRDVLAPLANVPVEVASDAVGVVIEKLLAARDLSAAHALVNHCAANNIPLPPEALFMLGAALAPTSPKAAISLLPSLQDTPQQTTLLLAILRALRRGRWDRLPRDAARQLYAAFLQLPIPYPDALRYDLRGCIAILISSSCAKEGMHLVARLAQYAPTWITLPFCRLLVRLLVARREFRMAAGVGGFAGHASPAVGRALRRYVVVSLERASATRLAMQVRGRDDADEVEGPRHGPDTELLRLRSAGGGSDESRRVIATLLETGRISAARRVYRQSRDVLDTHTRTLLGNAIIARVFSRRRAVSESREIGARVSQIEGPASQPGEHTTQVSVRRSGCDLVRNVVRARDTLVRTAGFVPDAVTTNLVLKALLRWRALASEDLAALYDHVMRGVVGREKPVFGADKVIHGRRGSARRVENDGGVLQSSVGGGSQVQDIFEVLEPLPSATSFARHVRPMLKMFIKAFYQRGDWGAARAAWRVLKAEEEKDRARRRVVEVARAAGVRRVARLHGRSKGSSIR
ncbi:uncharacterized protein SCHCODRAFT_02541341 [Schizophyllum commune H4-8]|uniref:Uncharacterized protein n=1 Tax=Schizophyllum commune (strain H4-8 / FGSC 9210) TaxID=578458 RepID=D8Q5T5_SCHCM|nr:uncharacterized protein SCHCODRAFT_02541341 [Schizophyllum commune H4-8]KAI5892038.1 hypothetical protein SCHCODRAFT_02541341 [Schizophyllum commune H4-8]